MLFFKNNLMRVIESWSLSHSLSNTLWQCFAQIFVVFLHPAARRCSTKTAGNIFGTGNRLEDSCSLKSVKMQKMGYFFLYYKTTENIKWSKLYHFKMILQNAYDKYKLTSENLNKIGSLRLLIENRKIWCSELIYTASHLFSFRRFLKKYHFVELLSYSRFEVLIFML